MPETEFTLKVTRNRDLSQQELVEITALCSRAFKQDYQPFMDVFQNAVHVTGYYKGTLVSHALWITRWLQSGDLPLMKTAYVEAVVTEEEYRNRGFASAVMTRLAEEIKGYDLGGLCTGSPDFYSRLGWQKWTGPLFIRKEKELISTPGAIVMVLSLPGSPPLDLVSSLSAEWREGELW